MFKLDMKKFIYVSLCIFMGLFFLIGGEFAKRDIFPYDSGIRLLLPKILHVSKKNENFCLKQYSVNKKFEFFSNKKIDNIFIGDSVVQELYSTKLFNLNYDVIAVNGATIDCSKIMLGYIKKIQPKNLIIYLGGNDADGTSNYNSDRASKLYIKFISELDQINSILNIYIIGINYGLPSRRNSDYVQNLNKNLKKIENKRNIFYIDSFKELDFRNKSYSDLSYDGEHLTYLGYEKWFNYLSNKIEDFILN